LLAHAGKPLQQRLAALHHDAGMAAQHLRIAGRQVELAAPDINPHVVVGDVEEGIAGEPQSDDVEQARDPLVRDLHVHVFEVDGIAEVLGRTIVCLLHVGHSALIPAALMIGHHLSISAFWNAPSASGVSCSRGKMSWLSSINRLRTVGSSRARTAASLSLATMSFGVPLGAQNACQNEKWNPGNPASSVVGISGAVASRCLAVTA